MPWKNYKTHHAKAKAAAAGVVVSTTSSTNKHSLSVQIENLQKDVEGLQNELKQSRQTMLVLARVCQVLAEYREGDLGPNMVNSFGDKGMADLKAFLREIKKTVPGLKDLDITTGKQVEE